MNVRSANARSSCRAATGTTSGPACRCPICGSYRVSKLRSPDRIDRFHRGFLNLVERFAGSGQLYHCRWCRLQFYDRRPLAAEPAKSDDSQEQVDGPVAPADTAKPANPA